MNEEGTKKELKRFKGQEYLPLQIAAQYTSHSQEYLRLLARSEKLKARKLGRNWYTTHAALKECFGEVKQFDWPAYLSLQEAAQYTPHSQEYLRLLVRRKKLEAWKLGRNWYTTRTALAATFGADAVASIPSEPGHQVAKLPQAVAPSVAAPKPKRDSEVLQGLARLAVSVSTLAKRVSRTEAPQTRIIQVGAPPSPTPDVASTRHGWRRRIRRTIGAVAILCLLGIAAWTAIDVMLITHEPQAPSPTIVVIREPSQTTTPTPPQSPVVVPGGTTVIREEGVDLSSLTLDFVTTQGNVTNQNVRFSKNVTVDGSLSIPTGNLQLGSGTIEISNSELIRNLNAEYWGGRRAQDYDLDYITSQGSTTNNVTFFNAGLYGGDGSFQTIGVARDASFGSPAEQGSIKFRVYASNFEITEDGNLTIPGTATVGGLTGAGLSDCSGSNKLSWDATTGEFACIPESGSVLSSIQVREGTGAFADISSISLNASHFTFTASGSEAIIALDWGSGGPASLSQDETVTGLWTFAGGASISGNFEVTGTASISALTIAGSSINPLNFRPASNSLDFDEFVDSMTLDANTTVALNSNTLTVGGLAVSGSGVSVSVPFELSNTASIGNTLQVSGDVVRNLVLQTTGTTAFGPSVAFSQGGTEKFVIYNPVTTSDLNFFAGGSDRLVIKGLTGNVGIAHNNAPTRFYVNGGAAWFNDEAVVVNALQVAGTASASYSRFGIGTTGHTLSAASDLLITGLLEVDSNAFFDASASISGNFELTGTVSSHLTPTITNTYSLGTSALRWSNLFATNASISGTLEAGTVSGSFIGTLNPGFTTGSVVFQGASGLTEDNANLFWDDSSNLLRIGPVSAASETLEISGTASISGNVTVTGNVGIGQVPSYMLDIGKADATGEFGTFPGIRVINTSTTTNSFADVSVSAINGGLITTIFSDGLGGSTISGNTVAGVIGTRTNHPFALISNGVPRLWVPAGGNIGIGTSNPSNTLEIAGELQVTNIVAGRGIRIDGPNTVPSSQSIQFGYTAGFAGKIVSLTKSGGGGSLLFYAAPNGTTQNEVMRISENGNVGIGTANAADARLEVSGTASISSTLTVVGNITSPGVGASSEKFGASATAGGANGVAIGNAANASSTNTTALGTSATASGVSSIAIGTAATSAGDAGSIAIGLSSTVNGISGVGIGTSVSVAGTNAIAIGNSANAGFNSSIAIGVATTTTATNQFVSGGGLVPINNVYFGKGVTDATPTAYTINGTGGSGTDIAGGGVTLAGGRGTGTGIGGSLLFQTAPAGTTGSSLNSLSTRLTIDSTGLALFANNVSVSGTFEATTFRTPYAQTITVAKSGGDFTSIQTAYTYAKTLSPSSTNQILIKVMPGAYNETLTLDTNYISVDGSGRDVTRIYAAPGNGNGVVTANFTGSDVTFSDITIDNAESAAVHAIAFKYVSGSPTLRQNKIVCTGNCLTGNGGLMDNVASGSYENNFITASGSSAFVDATSGGYWKGNRFTARANATSGGYWQGNTFDARGTAHEALITVTGGTFESNLFYGGSAGGYTVQAVSGGTFSNNSIFTGTSAGALYNVSAGTFTNNYIEKLSGTTSGGTFKGNYIVGAVQSATGGTFINNDFGNAFNAAGAVTIRGGTITGPGAGYGLALTGSSYTVDLSDVYISGGAAYSIVINGGTDITVNMSNVTLNKTTAKLGVGTGTFKGTYSIETSTSPRQSIVQSGTGSTLQLTQLSTGNILDLLASNSGNVDSAIRFQLDNAGVATTYFTVGVDDSDSQKFKISTTGLGTSDRLTIDSTGLALFANNVSISGNFELTGTVSSHLIPTITDTYDLGSTTVRWRNLYLAPGSLHIGTSGDEAVIDYNVTNDYLAFKPDGSTNQFQLFDTGAASLSNTFYVTSTGNVGIGDTTPTANLEVAGTTASFSNTLLINSGSNDTVVVRARATANTSPLNIWRSDGVEVAQFVLDGSGLPVLELLNPTTGTASISLGIANVDLVNRVIVSRSGNPTIKIKSHADGNSTIQRIVNLSEKTISEVTLDGSGHPGVAWMNPAGTATISFAVRSDLPSYFAVGNIGIGNTTPNAKLDVTGNILASSSGNVGITLNSTTSDDTRFTIQATGASDRLDILGSASQVYLTILKGGNVGIGTTVPTTTLDVDGNASISGTFEVGTLKGSSLVLGPVSAPSETLEISGTASISSTLTVTGNITSPGTGASSEKFGVSATAAGQFSLALGNTADAQTTGGISVGYQATTRGNYGIALGYLASTSTATDAIAIGHLTEAGASYAIGVGYQTNVSGAQSVGIGLQANASGTHAVALGYLATVRGTYDIALGFTASTSTATNAIAIGRAVEVSGIGGIGIGGQSEARGAFAIGIGYTAIARANYDIALGYLASTSASTADGIAIGRLSEVSGSQAISIGLEATTRGSYGIALGYQASTSTALDAIAIGRTAEAAGAQSVALGYLSAARTTTSIAIGSAASVSGTNAIAIGVNAEAVNDNTLAIGVNAYANGGNSLAIGGHTVSAIGAQAQAFGTQATANGAGAHAFGYSAIARANSVAVGYGAQAGNTTSGNEGTAFGYTASATNSSVALGARALISSGVTGSVAIGRGATASVSGTLVIGSSLAPVTNVYFSEGIRDASPTLGVTINGTGGLGTNIAGASVTLAGGKSTGTGIGGSLLFQTAPAGTTGSSLNSLSTRLTIDTNGLALFANNVSVSGTFEVGSGGFWTDGTNVGIGTSTPANLLHIYSSSSAAAVVSLQNDGTGAVQLQFKTDTENRRFLARDGSGTVLSQLLFNNNSVEIWGATAASKSAYFDVLNGRLGIGTTVPSGPLDVQGIAAVNFDRAHTGDGSTSRAIASFKRTYSGGAGADGIGGHIDFYAETETEGLSQPTGQLKFATTDATAGTIDSDFTLSTYLNGVAQPALFVQSNGNVGIGTTTPGALTHIASIGADGQTLLRLQDSNSTCDFTANAGTPSCGSDLRLKKDIASIPSGALDKLLTLDVVNYHWKTDALSASLQTGFIAQDVQQLFPDLVRTSVWNDGQPALFLSQTGLIPHLVKGLQELAAKHYQLADTLAAQGTTAGSVEIYPFESDIQEGMLVVPSSTSFVITDGKKLPRMLAASRPYDSAIIGVMSVASAAKQSHNLPESVNPRPVVFEGRAEVLVSLENGPIKVGDRITSSRTPGVGMRATEPGQVVGMALEQLDTLASGSYGRILLSVDAGYWAPNIASVLTSGSGDSTTMNSSLLPSINQIASAVVTWFRDTLNITLENGLVRSVKGWFVEVQTDKLCVGGTCITEAELEQLLQNNGITPTPKPVGLSVSSSCIAAEDSWRWTITNGSTSSVSFSWRLGPILASISGQGVIVGGSTEILTLPYTQDPFLYVAPVGENFGTGTAFQNVSCTPTTTPTPLPSDSPTPTPNVTLTPTPSPEVLVSPSPSVSPEPSASPSPSATLEPTPEPTPPPATPEPTPGA